MPCNIFKAGGATIIACGPRGRARKCFYCSRPSSALCDYPVPDPKSPLGTKTCDKPLCGQCARHSEPDTDVCRIHPAKPQWETPTIKEEFICSNCDGAPDGGHAGDVYCTRYDGVEL